ncbi:MAG: PilZ domain-containing protein [Polyangiaceae bacterium]
MGEPKREDNRRSFDRFDVTSDPSDQGWAVDCETEDTFLYASISNISQMGIFVSTREPLAIGTRLMLSFTPPPQSARNGRGSVRDVSVVTGPFKLEGVVAWVNAVKENGDNPNPGMGVRFVDLTLENRERLVDVIRTIAYLRDKN